MMCIYSFGMTIIEAARQRFPFGMIPDVAVKHKVATLCELLAQPAEVSDTQWELIKGMFSTNPDDRIDTVPVL